MPVSREYNPCNAPQEPVFWQQEARRMIAHILRPCANAEQISPPALEEQSSTAPNLALPGVPGCLPSPKTSLGHCSRVPESTVPGCGDVASSAPRSCCAVPGSPAAPRLRCEAESCSAELQEETGR